MRFALLLARTIGRTLAELRECMTAHEFGLWQAAYVAEPWGEAREDLHAGIVAAAVTNVAGKVMPKGKLVTPADFFVRWGKQDQIERAPDDEPAPLDFFRGM